MVYPLARVAGATRLKLLDQVRRCLQANFLPGKTDVQSEPDITSAVEARGTKRGIAANGLTQRNSRVIQPSCGVAGGSDGSSRGSAKFDLATFYLPEYLHIQMPLFCHA